MPQRGKGQEVSINIVRGGVLENTFTAILNFNSEDVFEIIKKGYLGEKGDRHDYVFSESKGDFEMHLQTQDWYRFRIAVKAKATREQPDLQFNISKTLFFPNGESPTVNFNDVSFGTIPENVPARNDYVKVKIEFACDGDDIALS